MLIEIGQRLGTPEKNERAAANECIVDRSN